MLRCRVVVLLLLLVLSAATARAAEFFVATDGNDAAVGTRAAPFATVQRARDAVRQLHAGAAVKEAVTVFLRQGVYYLPETLTLGPQDSGAEQFPVTYAAWGTEKVVLSGGRPIAGLVEKQLPSGARAWTARVPADGGDWYFRQLFVARAGELTFSRRYRPDTGMKVVAGLTYSPAKKGMAHRAAQKDFVFHSGDIQQWPNLADVEVVALHTWASSRLRIESVDLRKNVVTFTGFPTFRIGHWWPGGRNPYFVENVKEALVEPGRWYFDRPTRELTYLPLPGETLADTRLVAPRLARVLALEGDWKQGQPVQHVVFQNITFAHNEWPLPPQGYGGSQAQPDLPAAVELTGATAVEFQRCTIAHVGNYGLGLGRGCHRNRIVGCRLTDLAGGGIKVGDIAMKPTAAPPELPTDNAVENCAISDGGLMYFSSNAIWGGIVRGLKLRHNEIWNFPYAGIAVGWMWNDTPTGCGGNLIEYNHIHHVCTLLADGASIYTLGRQPGTVIRGNVLHDNRKSEFTKEHWQLGIYLDEGSAEILVENNLLYRVGTHGFNCNGGAQNVVRNNVFTTVYGNHEPFHRCHKRPFSRGNVFEHNITACDSPNLADAVWDLDLMRTRNNLYFNVAGQQFGWKGKTFAEWQALGQDAGSILADPLFVDPAHDDFRLKPDSPALRLGFQPIDYTRAGLEPAYRDVRRDLAVTPAPIMAMHLPPFVEPPPGFDFDFEDIPVGMIPRGFSCNGCTQQANFSVSDDAARHGRRSLKVVDAKAAAKSFMPYLTYSPSKPLESGKIRFSCAVRQHPQTPLLLEIAFRDHTHRGHPTKEFTSGPALRIERDGRITCNGQTLATVPLGTWAEIGLEFDFGARTGQATVKAEGQTPSQTSFALAKEFTACTWLGLVAADAVDGAAWIDDLKLVHEP